MRRRLETFLLRLAVSRVAATPFEKGERIARGVFRLAWPLIGGPRRRAMDRMAEVWPEKALGERESVLRRSVESLAATAVETLYMDRMGPAFFERVEIQPEGVEGLRALANGGIVVTGHLGNWELAGALVARSLSPVPFLVVGRSQDNSLLDEITVRTRKAFGMGHATRHWREAVRLAKALVGGTVLGLVSDQHAGTGVEVSFLGRPARAFRGPVAYAQRAGLPLAATACFREAWGRFRWVVGAPFGLEGLTEREAAQRYTRELEMLVEEAPDQWLWLHNRWKGFEAAWPNPDC